MPDTTRPIDDRTFFILYALTKKGEIDIPSLRWIYPETYSVKDILRDIDIFRIKLKLVVAFYWNENPNSSIEILRVIKENIDLYKSVPEILNTEILYNTDFGLDTFVALDNNILPLVLGCKLKCENPKILSDWLLKYFKASKNFREKLYHQFIIHEKVYKKALNMVENNMKSPYCLTLSDFKGFYDENLPAERYAFSYFMYELEYCGKINVKNLGFQKNTPVFIFDFTTKRTKYNKEVTFEGNEVAHWCIFSLYENGVLHCSKNDKNLKLAPLQYKVLKYCYDRATKNIYTYTYENLANIMNITSEKVPHYFGKVTKVICDILEDNKAYIFKNNQKEKCYILTEEYLQQV